MPYPLFYPKITLTRCGQMPIRTIPPQAKVGVWRIRTMSVVMKSLLPLPLILTTALAADPV
ncbi:MAG: hypothetical protein AAF386_09120, partial [Pseudomonadota bacterium]